MSSDDLVLFGKVLAAVLLAVIFSGGVMVGFTLLTMRALGVTPEELEELEEFYKENPPDTRLDFYI